MSKTQAPDYFLYNDRPVEWVMLDEEHGQYQTKDGTPIPLAKVFEDGTPITKEEYDKACQTH